MKKSPVSEEFWRLPVNSRKVQKGYVLVRKALASENPNGKIMVVQVSNGRHWYANPDKLIPHQK